MKLNSTAISCFLMAVALPYFAGAAPALDLTVRIPPRSLPCTAIPIQLLLRNTGEEDVVLINPSNVLAVSVLIRTREEGRVVYSGPIAVSRANLEMTPGDWPLTRLAPQSICRLDAALRCNWNDGLAKPLFLRADDFQAQFTYGARIRVGSTRTNVLTRSEWTDFAVLEPASTLDQGALERVLASSFSGMMLFPDDISMLNETSLDKLQLEMDSILEGFPQSYLAPYATLARSAIHQARAIGAGGLRKQREFNEAITILDSLKGDTNFALRSEAETRWQTSRRLIGLAPEQLATPVPGSESIRTNALAVVTAELESLFYDVVGFARYYPDANREYLRTVLLLHDELAQGRLSQKEFERRRADLFRQTVTNSSSPLPPEEWRRRYEEYRKEAAERERQRQDSLQRGAIDSERILRGQPK